MPGFHSFAPGARGKRVPTSGGGFAGKTVTLDTTGKPDWALGVNVNGDGNIVLDVKSKGTLIFFL